MTVKELEVVIEQFNKEVNDKFATLGDSIIKLSNTVEANSKAVKDDLLGIRSVIINNLVAENKKIQLKKQELENRVVVLEDRLFKLGKEVNQIEQNNWKNNVEIEGIPDNVKDDALPGEVVKIMNFLTNENISVSDVEDCHRLPSRTKPKPIIVRMKRNILTKAKKNAKKLKGVDTQLGFPRGTQLFVRDNLSPNMKNLAYNARILKRNGIIDDTWFSNAAMRIKAGDFHHKITHETDLHRIYSDFQHFSFDRDFCQRVLCDNLEYREMKKFDDLEGAWNDYIGPDEAAQGVAETVAERMRAFTG